uniref:T-cell receptor alpha chain constant domain-containing protein n=1 Tax=Vombatus ursinus TaxID=29139 RepID=A0A4X2M0F4_VOMUR
MHEGHHFLLRDKEKLGTGDGYYFKSEAMKNEPIFSEMDLKIASCVNVEGVKHIPDITDPQPALYQLTSPKSSDTSVCLLTDFDSSNKYANSNDSTVLEMMTMESKSYGAVIWGSKSSFNCTNAFQQNIVNLTQPSGSTCKVKDVKQSFETDKDLNLMNMFLIFLRVIFLKTAGFNLLMTLRLWSN